MQPSFSVASAPVDPRSPSPSFPRASPAAEQVRAAIVTYLPQLRRRALALARNNERAEDLVQDAVERALRFADTFQSGTQIRAWLMRILQNVFVSQCRRTTIERRIVEGARKDPNLWTHSHPSLMTPGLSPPVDRALRALPPRLREVVHLVDLQAHSYKDAAANQKVPVGTVMSRLHRGRARLAAALREPTAA